VFWLLVNNYYRLLNIVRPFCTYKSFPGFGRLFSRPLAMVATPTRLPPCSGQRRSRRRQLVFSDVRHFLPCRAVRVYVTFRVPFTLLVIAVFLLCHIALFVHTAQLRLTRMLKYFLSSTLSFIFSSSFTARPGNRERYIVARHSTPRRFRLQQISLHSRHQYTYFICTFMCACCIGYIVLHNTRCHIIFLFVLLIPIWPIIS